MKKIFIILFSGFSLSWGFSQNQTEVDSLQHLLNSAKNDSQKVDLMISVAAVLNKQSDENAKKYAGNALALSEKIQYRKGEAMSYNILGEIYEHKSDYEKSLDNYHTAISILDTIFYRKEFAKIYQNIGTTMELKGDYDTSLQAYLKSLSVRESIGDSIGIAASLMGIGNVYYNQYEYEKTLNYYLKTLEIYKRIHNESGMAAALANIGIVYSQMGDNDKAIEYYMQSLKIEEKSGFKMGVAQTYSSIGVSYYYKKDFIKALEYFQKSLNIHIAIDNKSGIANASMNIGSAYSELGNFEKAFQFQQQALETARLIGEKRKILLAYKSTSDVYAKTNNYKKAYEYSELSSAMKDSVFREENSKQMAEMQTKYETEKKEKEIELQKSQIEKKEAEISQQTTQKYSFAAGLTFMLALAFFIFRSYTLKKKANVLLSEKNILIEHQKLIVEQKNKDITDSIEYAKTLQDAILPDIQTVMDSLPGSFIYFRPRDIVSGDFYWYHKKRSPPLRRSPIEPTQRASHNTDKKVLPPNDIENFLPEANQPLTEGGLHFIIAADCTGHGVPGAFVSMACNNILNEVIIHKDFNDPGKILTETNKGICESFKKEAGKARANDGMDVAVCVLNTGNSALEYAGAMNSALIVREGQIIELPADKMPIGGFTKYEYQFRTQKINLLKGDSVYIFSDGFHDQFGGEKGKKFMFRRFKGILLQIANLLPHQQMEHLAKALAEWKGNHEQVDDILVIGFKV